MASPARAFDIDLKPFHLHFIEMNKEQCNSKTQVYGSFPGTLGNNDLGDT